MVYKGLFTSYPLRLKKLGALRPECKFPIRYKMGYWKLRPKMENFLKTILKLTSKKNPSTAPTNFCLNTKFSWPLWLDFCW
jgi:hypothetical protein